MLRWCWLIVAGCSATPAVERFIAEGDFDHDGVPNAIDLCPLDPTVGSVDDDADRDRIGDACDRNPKRDCIVLFDYIDEDRPYSDLPWELGDWSIGTCADGRSGFCSPPVNSLSALSFPRELSISHVETEVRLFAGAPLASVQLFADLDPEARLGRGCALRRVGPTHLAGVEDLAGSISTGRDAVDAASVPFGDPDTNVVLQWVPPGDCRVSTLAAPTDEIEHNTDHAQFVAVRAEQVHMAVHYVIGYGSCD